MGRLHLQYNAPVVLTFSLLSLGALLLDMATGGLSTQLLFCVYRAPLTDPLTYARLFGHVLGHAGYSHFMGNIMLLLVIGPPLEEKYGSPACCSASPSPRWSPDWCSFSSFPARRCWEPAALSL